MSDLAAAAPLFTTAKNLRRFWTMWVGQFVSLVGTTFTRFAFGVWVYQQTHSATQFSLIALTAGLPSLLLAPVAGALVDRWDRRRVMVVGNLLAALASGVMAAIINLTALATWHVYLYVAVGSLLQAFQWPAYVASTTLLVPKRHLGRASGLVQLAQGAAGFAPLPAGFLLAAIGVGGIVWLDFASFVFAALALLLVTIPTPPESDAGRAAKGSLGHEIAFGWRFIRERPGLFGLLVYFAMLNLVFSMATVLVTPLVLSFADAKVLGGVQFVLNLGFLAGGLVMSLGGGPQRRIHGVLAGGALLGLALLGAGLRASPALIAGAMACGLFAVPIVNGCSQAIWQAKVPPDVQGRVFAVRRVIAQATIPLAQLLAGPLADRVFNPLLAPGGALAGSLGPWLGVGPGRGIGLLYLVLAAAPLAVTLWGYAHPRIRQVEDELPDAVG